MNRPLPAPGNDFLADHIRWLLFSYRHWTGEELANSLSVVEAARWLYHAPFALVSHDNQADPVFNYANLTAQSLFGMNWARFTRLPSRHSAEATEQKARQRLLEQVNQHGFIADYQGIRVSKSGRRFRVEGAVVWNVIDQAGALQGQAARLDRWYFLDNHGEPEGS